MMNTSFNGTSNQKTQTQTKEIELIKTADELGVTLCNGGDGKVIIRRIVPGSVASRAPHAIRVGDIIEKINGDGMIGKGHREVAAKLHDLPLGSSFQLRLISVRPAGSAASSRTSFCTANSHSTLSKSTLTRKVSQNSFENRHWETQLQTRLNTILAEYYGFVQDDNLVQFVWDLLTASDSLAQFRTKLNTKLAMLQVPDHVAEQIWNTIGPNTSPSKC